MIKKNSILIFSEIFLRNKFEEKLRDIYNCEAPGVPKSSLSELDGFQRPPPSYLGRTCRGCFIGRAWKVKLNAQFLIAVKELDTFLIYKWIKDFSGRPILDTDHVQSALLALASNREPKKASFRREAE
jgi:hypothetical protein